MDLSETEELYHGLGHFAQKRFGFNKPPTLHLVSDGDNASKPLGKTAYYDPQGMAVTIYTDNRHTKDILRSLAHELVHHTQNENGMLNDTGYHGEGYAQKNKNLRQSEKEAYLKGSICFRDWEDSLKQSKPTIYNEWRNIMSTKNWKNNELMENLTEKFGFKMDLTQLDESSCGSKEKYEEELNEGEECPKCNSTPCKCDDIKEAEKHPLDIVKPHNGPDKDDFKALRKGKKPTNEVRGTHTDDLEASIKGLKSDIANHTGSKEKLMSLKASLKKMEDQLNNKKPTNEVRGTHTDDLEASIKGLESDIANHKGSKEKLKSLKTSLKKMKDQLNNKKPVKESRIMKIIKNEIRKQLKERKR